MNRNRCSQTGRFLPQNGGMFAPGAFQNLGNLMLNPQGAAQQPPHYDSSDDEEEELDRLQEEELERLRSILARLQPPYAGGGQNY